jgi:hypothetical protein
MRYQGMGFVRHLIEQQKMDQRSESPVVSQTQSGKPRLLDQARVLDMEDVNGIRGQVRRSTPQEGSMNLRFVLQAVSLATILWSCGGGSDSAVSTPISVNAFADPAGPHTGTLTISNSGGPPLAQEPFFGNSSTIVNAVGTTRTEPLMAGAA